MENILLKRYMSKSLVNLFGTNHSGVAYCELNNFVRTNIMLNKLEDLSSDFDAVTDRNNDIHIVYQDMNKNIIYATISGINCAKSELLKARSNASATASNFRIFKNDKYLSVLYTIFSGNKHMLCSQFINSDSVPEVIDVINGNFLQFIPLADCFGNVYVIYCENSSSEIGYKKLTWSKKEWSEFKSLGIKGDVNMLSGFIDEKNLVHLCYKTADGLFYKNAEVVFEDIKWRTEILLTRQHTAMSLTPIINKIDDALLISWGTFDRIIATFSTDNGATWSKLREIGITYGGDIQKIRVAMPLSSVSSEIYGYILNNKLNVPMLGKYIDTEFEKENDFNNDFIGVPHNEGYEVEKMTDIYPMNNTKANFLRIGRNTGLSEAEIEQIKNRIAMDMKKNNSVLSDKTKFIFEDDAKIISVKGFMSQIEAESSAPETSCDSDETMEDMPKRKDYADFDNLKNPLEKIYEEIAELNSALKQILIPQNECVQIKNYRPKKKRTKASLYKMHIKKR